MFCPRRQSIHFNLLHSLCGWSICRGPNDVLTTDSLFVFIKQLRYRALYR